MTEELLKARCPVILETNFNPAFANEKIRNLKETYQVNSLQIRCISDGGILLQRFIHRANSPERHPGHKDHESLNGRQTTLQQGKIEKLNIGGEYIDFDTTNLTALTYDDIFDKVASFITHQ